MVQGKFFGSFHLVAPVATKRCGTFAWFTYLWMAVLVGCAQGLEEGRHLILLHELPDHLHRLGRRVGVVVGDEVDLAAVDAALVVDLLEVGG
jgi:hypothetical protein